MELSPKAKRLKTEELDPIFHQFRRDRKQIEFLTEASTSLKMGFSLLKLGALRVNDCYARTSVNFTSAQISTSFIEDETGDQIRFKIGSIFKPAVSILDEYTSKEKPRIPADLRQRNALALLLKFIYKGLDQAALLQQKDYSGNEGEWALILAQHLLSLLAVERNYIIDLYKDYAEGFTAVCPCGEQDSLSGIQGDTTFGCRRGWHGQVDILMEGLLVDVMLHSDNEASKSESFTSATELKSSTVLSEKDKMQLIAETIVFSFLQRKINYGEVKNVLIPGIGISSNQVIGYFYDSEEDVLLQTHPLDLFAGYSDEKKKLNIYSVIFLWLTLNYKHFCSGIDDEMKKFKIKADYFTRVGDFLEVYRNEVDRPMHVNKSNSEEPFTWGWLQDQTGDINLDNCDVEFIELFPE